MAIVSGALTTVDRTKSYLGLGTLTDTETSVMEMLINAVTAYVEDYTGRTFMKTAYSNEVYDGPYDYRIVLNNYPVFEDETFTFQKRDAGGNSDDWSTIDASDYFVDWNEGVIEAAGRAKLILDVNKYRVTYTAGYDYDNITTFLGNTKAGDLELAAMDMIAARWFSRKGSPNIKGERLGDYSVTYGRSDSVGAFMKTGDGTSISMVESILDKYARFEITSALTPKNT